MGSGSIAVEATLSLLGLPHRLVEGATWSEEWARERVGAVNALRQVPTVVFPDGNVMSESGAVLLYLAEQHPAAELAPAIDNPLRGQFLRWMFYVSSAIYALHWINRTYAVSVQVPSSAKP